MWVRVWVRVWVWVWVWVWVKVRSWRRIEDGEEAEKVYIDIYNIEVSLYIYIYVCITI